MASPFVCASCGALNPLPPDALDHFELFGVERGYDIDQELLHRKYLALSRSIHPDVASQQSEEIRQRALVLSSELNRAYDTLQSPVSRAEYLLSLAGGPAAANDKSVPPELLGEVVMLREAIEEARGSGDMGELERIRQRVSAGQQAALEAIARLCRSLKPGAIKEQKDLRIQLNAVKYWNNLLEQLPTGASV